MVEHKLDYLVKIKVYVSRTQVVKTEIPRIDLYNLRMFLIFSPAGLQTLVGRVRPAGRILQTPNLLVKM